MTVVAALVAASYPSDMPCPNTILVNEIAHQGFQDALEIMLLIEVMQRQNQGRVYGRLSDAGAASTGIVVRNSMIARITLLVARCYDRIHAGKGDRHMRRAFDELLKDPNVRADLAVGGMSGKLVAAETLWDKANADPMRLQIEHFRHKFTAHLADPLPGMKIPDYTDFFQFARLTAGVMEALAHASGRTSETLADHANDHIMSSQEFWKPWDPIG